MEKRATSSDVARVAGVSKWTVARAFKPGASISEDARRRILEVAESMDYSPNLLARSLYTKKTNLVAVLVDDFANLHKLPLLEDVTLALQRQGLLTMLININQHYDHVEALLNVDQRQVDAAILLGTAFREEMLDARSTKAGATPLYVLARESTVASIPSISCDAALSMRQMGEHLWARGYRRPGFMTGPKTLSTVLGRQSHFAAFWAERGLAHVPEITAGHYSWHDAATAMRTYLATTPAEARIDVLMCENDALAIGAMDVARAEFGLRIPQDLAIAGYDNTELSSAPAFTLTSYRQPMDQMISALIEMLLGKAPPQSLSLPGELMVRGST